MLKRTLKESFICSNCYAVQDVNLKFDFKTTSSPLITPYVNRLEIRYFCTNCRTHQNHFMVDRGIAKTISMLNAHGFTTKFSCAGHSNVIMSKKGDKLLKYLDTPYVYFNSKKTLNMALITKLVAAGFDKFSVPIKGKGLRGYVDLKDDDQLNELLKANNYAIHYNLHLLDEKCEELEFKGYDVPTINKKMNQYIACINKKFYKIFEKYMDWKEN